MNLSTEKKIMDLENRLVVAKMEGEGVGGTGSLGEIDAELCLKELKVLEISFSPSFYLFVLLGATPAAYGSS